MWLGYCNGKGTIFRHKKASTNVHCVAIDLSKAHDQINYKIMIDKLTKANVSEPVVMILSFMLDQTYVRVIFWWLFEWWVGNKGGNNRVVCYHHLCFHSV